MKNKKLLPLMNSKCLKTFINETFEHGSYIDEDFDHLLENRLSDPDLLIGFLMNVFCELNRYNHELCKFANVTPMQHNAVVNSANETLMNDLLNALNKAQATVDAAFPDCD